MMGGMGAEEFGNVTLMKETAEEKKAAEDAVEEEAGDVDDPFAMMGGMGAEEFGAVTLVKETADEPAAEEKKDEEDEDEEECNNAFEMLEENGTEKANGKAEDR
eukprot:gnl/TRDRNA2_/TRDRNA2_140477_c0_seq2.p4 gnl/TRDRNA2_/TRDRNA2_140477_c0~~gnl/TRDRNA2_/TRDRNA2_140477_c0_seq2.p4  ORF type:complete len:104 (-),score=57.78 gnl/TRDRNA2_/TRDRNA2_140477_c0_seq2:219-530(-)